MKNILIYFSIILVFASCGTGKRAQNGNKSKGKDFVDLYYTQDVVEEEITLPTLQQAQYKLSKKIVYTSSTFTKGAYANEIGDIVLPDDGKRYQLIYSEDLPGLYDLKKNAKSTSKQNFFVNFATKVKGPPLRMTSTGGLYVPPKTFQWAGRLWTANSINGVNLMVRFKLDTDDNIVPIKLDGRVLEGSGLQLLEDSSSTAPVEIIDSGEIIDSPLNQDRVIEDSGTTIPPPQQQSPQTTPPPASSPKRMSPR